MPKVRILLYILLFSLPFSLVGFSVASASETKQKHFFFDNNKLQAYLNKEYTLFFQEKKFPFKLKDFSLWETSLVFQPDYSSEAETLSKCSDSQTLSTKNQKSSFITDPSICDLTKTISSVGHFKKGASLVGNNEKISEFVSSVSEQIIQAPRNAKIKMTAEKKLEILQPAQSGFELDEEKTIQNIKAILEEKSPQNLLSLETKETKALISKETLSDLKISDQIGHGESNFQGSPRNRIHNINVATELFDGMILAPNEEFSFTTTLGPVEKETGYKEELVIKNNETIPEYGGGVCQVSTTVFRAALNSGFKITARRNHAYPVQYYSPQGTDATIYIPSPDLKFINNTPGFVLFQANIEGRKLIFDIFGTSDNREVSFEGPTVTERTSEGILKVSLKQIVKKENGDLFFEDIFKSVYDNPAK